nr:MAG TPA: adenylate kinase [Caudoviricetes sp.]
MSKIDSIICTTVYTELLTAIDIFRCENCGHMYVEVFDLAEGYKYCPHCKAKVGENDD